MPAGDAAVSPVAVLIGPMAAGKTSVGRALAELLGLTFADLDQVIVQRTGVDIPALFREHGEESFRSLEHDALEVMLASHAGVLALGGGAPLRQENRALLAGRPVVLLDVQEDVAARRLHGGAGRPLLAGEDPLGAWRRIREERLPIYRTCARIAVEDHGGARPAVIARKVADALGLIPADSREENS